VTLGKVIAKVVAQHASTAAGRRGRQDYVDGPRKLIVGFSDLDKTSADVKAHHLAAAKAELKKASTTVTAAVTLGKKGRQLLHVKT
jgi:hypothetical protein